MGEIILLVILVMVVIFFAIFGLGVSLARVFRAITGEPDTKSSGRTASTDVTGRSDSSRPKPRHSLKEDVAASQRLINHLLLTGQITQETHQRLLGFLAKKFDSGCASKPIAPPKTSGSRPVVGEPTEEGVSSKLDQVADTPAPAISSAATSMPVPTAKVVSDAKADPESADAEVVEAIVVEATSAEPATLAPWDRPDPPPRAPRRSFAEVMSVFMQEKNMRWGELTSGILIVLSAVGLVVSLRDQLSDAIPYFSSILFMAITASIIAAGVYTLKKWKLRNTSRGTLVIGLLLIPLNFVAACVLSGGEERRELNDPLLWAAVIIGFGGFAALTWWAGKYLLRKHVWPLVVAIVGCGVGTLLFNRLGSLPDSSLTALLLSLPVAGGFLIGASTFDRRPWFKTYWGQRSTNRLFLSLGVASFAAITAISLLPIRAKSPMAAAVAMTPVLVLLCLVVSWFGSIIRIGQHAENSNNRMTGLTLQILGLILLGIFLLGSLANPLVFSFNCLIATIGLSVIAYHQQSYQLLPIAWSALSVGALAVLNLVEGSFEFDQWATPFQLRDALISGQSGLCLLACGAVVVGLQTAIAKRFQTQSVASSLSRLGLITGGGIFLVGCFIALVASIVNRQDVFDTMTASLLLAIAGIGAWSLVMRPISNRLRGADENLPVGKATEQIKQIIANVAALTTLVALAHALLWNPTISSWLIGLTTISNANWVWVFAIHGLLFGIAAAWKRPGPDDEAIEYWSAASSIVAVAGAIWLVPLQTGVATMVMAAATLSWWLVSWSLARVGESVPASIKNAGVPFVIATGILVAVAIGELGPRFFSWCRPIIESRHWLIQIIGLSVWAICWALLSAIFHRGSGDTRERKFGWLVSAYPRAEQVVVHGLVFVIGGLLLTSLANGTFAELFKNGNIQFSLAGEQIWVVATLAAISLAMIVLFIEQPTEYKAAAIIVLWYLAWACGAMPFEATRATGSALRWLVPTGGLIFAGFVSLRRWVSPGWAKFRSGLKLQGPSLASDRSTQQLINFALAIVVAFVLIISTATVTQVMINGAAALGGPAPDSWFGRMDKVISFGGPLILLVSTFLVYAISERRPWLATAGSAVFQYMVVLAVVLLFLSPHPKLASEWFVRVLQSVSLGMTIYGFAWWAMRDRIQAPVLADSAKQSIVVPKTKWLSQIEMHTLINGLLISSLAILVYVRFFAFPDQHAAWINSVGSSLGVIAWILYAALAFVVWRDKLSHQHSTSNWMWLTGWMGFVLVAMVAAIADYNLERQQTTATWSAFNILAAGTVLVTSLQAAVMIFLRTWKLTGQQKEFSTHSRASATSDSGALILPLFLSSAVALTFGVRGALGNSVSLSFYLTLIGCVAALLFVTGLFLRRAVPTLVAAAVALVVTGLVVTESPSSFSPNEPVWLNLSGIVLLTMTLVTLGFYLYRKRWQFEPIRRSFLTLPNIVILLVPIWILIGACIQVICDAMDSKDSTLVNPMGVTLLVMMLVVLLVSLWNDRRRFWVFAGCLTTLAIVIVCVSGLVDDDNARAVAILFACSLTVAVWGITWAARAGYVQTLKKLSAPRLVAWQVSMRRQLPVYSLILIALLLVVSCVAIFSVGERPLRYLVAAGPLAMAVGVGCLSDPKRRRWLQLCCLALITLGCLFIGWADLTPNQIFQRSGQSLLVRSLLVLAGAVFVFGGLIARWVRAGDSWIKSLRVAAAVICGWAILCLGLLITGEIFEFREGVGCGLTIAESVSAAAVTVGMIIGLISIAVRPEHDPFSFSVEGRQLYVYLAQLVAAGLVVHLYLSMPWLFQIGIKEYWPYIAMAICFGGVGLAHLLQQRNLTVLGQPLFTTATVLPVLTAAGIFAIDSKADGPLVLLTVGLAYLLISYMHRSAISGAASIVFGNLALWMFYNERFPQFSFFDHPQLWLIPPAVSVLIAGQFNRKSLSTAQLAMLRYICVAVIYVSSTSEIFISGLGDQLWPPMVLAALSVAGIMAGILLQVRSFLYLGCLFLLMAMITMVAHAHQRLDHVWPWWAFGITLGVAILVMFGLFEKKKNEMKVLADRLREWEV